PMSRPQIKAETTTSKTAYSILFAVSLAHLLNDLIQGIIPSMYPSLEQKFSLSMAQIGILTLCFQLAASILQPLVGAITDKYPKLITLLYGMLFSSLGVVLLSYAASDVCCSVALT